MGVIEVWNSGNMVCPPVKVGIVLGAVTSTSHTTFTIADDDDDISMFSDDSDESLR